MTEREIRDAVGRGQGRALIFLREATGDYRELILELCLRDQRFDRLFESRGDYMCRLIDTLAEPMDLVEPLGERLFKTKKSGDRIQIRTILAHLRELGSAGARHLLLKDFYRFRLKERPYEDGLDHLGEEGLHLIVTQSRRFEDYELRMIYEDAIEVLGKRRTHKAFNLLPGTRSERVYNWVRERNVTPSRELPSPSEWIKRTRSGEFVSYAGFWKSASDEEWMEVARLALETSDCKLLRRLNRLFGRKPWPLDVESDFLTAIHEPSKNLRRSKVILFRSTPSKILRDWALRQLETGPWREHEIAFSLLRRNAQRSDLALLTKALIGLKNHKHDFHSVGLDVLDLDCGATLQMLQLLYEYGSCDECRSSVVRRLVKRRAVTPVQRAECAEDSNKYTRAWAKRSLATCKN